MQGKKESAKEALNKLQRIDGYRKPQEYETQRNLYKEKRTAYKDLIREKKKKYKQKTYDTLMQNQADSKLFWNTIKEMKKRKIITPMITKEQWKEHFKGILNPVEEEQLDNNRDNLARPEDEAIHIPELDDQITEQEISTAIRKLKKGKAPGIDEILPEFLIEAETNIKSYLIKLFNKMYDYSYFPTQWSKAIIVPLFKKGDKNNPGNYRGISLLSVTSKIFTSIINTRLYDWAESEGKISREQAGFRKNYSTIDHIIIYINNNDQ